MMVFILVFWVISQKGNISSDQNLIDMENRCFSGSVTICAKAGEAYEKKGDYEKAIEFFDAACIGGEALSCIKLYVVYSKGKWGKKRNFNAAIGYSTRAGEILWK